MQKAWYYEEHGPKEVLKMGYFPIPTPKDDQLLVQVKAAALNPIDFKIRQRPLVVPVHFPVSGCLVYYALGYSTYSLELAS